MTGRCNYRFKICVSDGVWHYLCALKHQI